MTAAETVTYPEHEKLKALAGKNQLIGDFIEWLAEQGFVICDDNRESVDKPIEQWLAEYFDIDRAKLSAEKDAMYAALVANQETSS